MDLFEIDDTQRVRREEAAARLHALADALARNNAIEFQRGDRRITVRVPDNCSVSTHQCAAPPGDKSFADASSAIKLSNLGWISAGVGLAAVAGGMVWYIGGKKTAKEESVVAAPWVTSESAGFAVMGHL